MERRSVTSVEVSNEREKKSAEQEGRRKRHGGPIPSVPSGSTFFCHLNQIHCLLMLKKKFSDCSFFFCFLGINSNLKNKSNNITKL